VICCVKGTSIRLGKFAPNIEFYIRVNIRVEVSGYQKLQVALINGGYRFLDYHIRVMDRLLYRLASKNIKFATHES
jgi:hypothetical protein